LFNVYVYLLNKNIKYLTMKKCTTLFTALILLLSFSSCNNDDDMPTGPRITTFTAAMLMGSNEVPANNSTAMGTAELKFNNTTKVFTLTITHNVSSISAGHIHKGATGTNGGVVFPLSTLTSPISYTSAPLTTEQEADLMANLYYVNLHSPSFPGGEIRGQLIQGATTTSNTGGSGGGSGY
jgi:hypothetical protein